MCDDIGNTGLAMLSEQKGRKEEKQGEDPKREEKERRGEEKRRGGEEKKGKEDDQERLACLHMAVENKQLLPRILHHILTEMMNQPSHGDTVTLFIFEWD